MAIHEKGCPLSCPLIYMVACIANNTDCMRLFPLEVIQGSYRLEKYFNLEGYLEKSLRIKSALKSTGKSLKSLEKSLNSTIFYKT